MGWLWFAVVQAVTLLFTVLGYLVLVIPCLGESWHLAGNSVKPLADRKFVDAWDIAPLNWIYGNPEDGVSGQTARLIDGSHYMPDAWAPWRAYCWSALRNPAGQLKYVFAWNAGPFFTTTLFGRTFKAGWQQEAGGKVPVLSL